jgi:hypothetical protein
VKKDGIQHRRRISEGANLDFDACSTKSLRATRRDWIGIAHRCNDAGNTRLNDRVGTWWLLTLMCAGLEGNDQCRPPSPLTSLGQCHSLRVAPTVLRMPSFTHRLTTLKNDGTN